MLVAICCCLSVPLPAQAPRLGSGPATGFSEAVLSVSDLDRWVELFTEVGAWEVVYRGALPESVQQYYGLPVSGAPRNASEVVLANPGTDRGSLRLIDFGIAGADLIRPAQQTWDTGAIFDLNIRVLSVADALAAVSDRGWDGVSQPVEFTFGPFTVREVLVRAPDGVVFALIERVAPPLEGWPHLKQFSRFFNSSQVVAEFDQALAFYRDQLGWKIYLEHEGASKETGPNVLGLPHNLTTAIPRRVVILSPDGQNDGSVELLSFEGAVGADYSDRGVAPHRGILALRFAVADLDAYRRELGERGVVVEGEIAEFAQAPLGTVRSFFIESPEGARLEFYEVEARTE